MYFVSCSSMYLMMVISIDKLFIVYEPFMARKMLVSTRLCIVLLCTLLALFWSTLPLLGWSHYSMEMSRTSCSVEWADRSLGVTSYNITIFVFVFFIPFVTILYFNVKLIVFLKRFYLKKNEFDVRLREALASTTIFVPDTGNRKRTSSTKKLEPKSVRMTFIMVIYICKCS